MSLKTEAGSSVYHGIKKLWTNEVNFWKGVVNPEYFLYQVPNSKYNTYEYWLVEQQSDLKTLERYLKEVERPKDFKDIQNYHKIAK